MYVLTAFNGKQSMAINLVNKNTDSDVHTAAGKTDTETECQSADQIRASECRCQKTKVEVLLRLCPLTQCAQRCKVSSELIILLWGKKENSGQLRKRGLESKQKHRTDGPELSLHQLKCFSGSGGGRAHKLTLQVCRLIPSVQCPMWVCLWH